MSKTKTRDLDFHIFKRVLSAATPYKSLLTITILFAVFIAPLTSARPYIVKVMVDDYIMTQDIAGLRYMALVFVGVIVANAMLRYAFILSSSTLGQSVIKDLRTQVFDKIIKHKLKYFNDTPIGTVTTRIINDNQAINSVFQQGVFTIVADILSIIAIVMVMFYTSWRLALISLVMLPFMIIATYVFKEKVKAAYQVVRKQISNMNAFLQEQITGMRVVQIFNAEDRQKAIFKTMNREYTQANLNSVFYYATFFPVVDLIAAIALALMIWFGSGSYLADKVSFGALVAFPMYLSLLFRPVRMLADKFNQMQMGLVAAERVFAILDLDAHISNTGTNTIDHIEGRVVFDTVSFSYDGTHDVLQDISFSVEPHDTLAIVGSTGSGKSTIINLLNRFYDIDRGTISVDGVDVKQYELYAYRKCISIVLQDVFLFNGSILDNITLRDAHIAKGQVVAAAKSIGAHQYILDFPNGYDYMLMERGNNLSAGQRQLVSFVRALVFDPDILILDEATSSIDTETEAVIQTAIEKLTAKRTSIVIAHRLTTIRNADQILVLDAGKIVERGSHDELVMLEDGRYRELYEMQFVEE